MFHDTWPFIGSLGRLVEVPFTASEGVSRADRYVESTTVEGARRVQVRPAAPRSWSVDVRGASADEVSGLEAFAQGAWGAGPWHWVSVAAQVGNVLTPREALLLDRAGGVWGVGAGCGACQGFVWWLVSSFCVGDAGLGVGCVDAWRAGSSR